MTLAACPALRSGTYALVSRRGEVQEMQLDLSQMRVSEANGTTMTLVPTAEACRFNGVDAQGAKRVEVAFGAEGVGLGVSEATADGDRATTLTFPKQALALSDLAGKWVAIEWDRKSSVSLLPRFAFFTAELGADGSGVFQGCSQVAGVADCADPARRSSGTLSINAKGQVVTPGGGLGYAYRTSDGTHLIAWGKPNGDGMTILTRVRTMALPVADGTQKIWEAWGSSTIATPDRFVGNALGAFTVPVLTLNPTAGSATMADGKTLFVNKPLNGMFYQPAVPALGASGNELVGLEVKGVMWVMGYNTGSSTSFGIDLFRP